jgi:dolichol kinase
MIIQLFGLAAIMIVMALVGRWLIDRHDKDNEKLRKLVHVIHGGGLAALAFVVPLQFIIVVETIFLISMLVARYLAENFTRVPWIKYLRRMYSVGRLSFGEFFFPISSIILVFIAESKWEFAAAILILGIADTVAALVGKAYGKGNSYLVFKQRKSLAGSISFLLTTFVIIWAFVTFHSVDLGTTGLSLIVLTSILVTTAENLGVYGSDNLLIPIVAVLLLNQL